MILRTMLAPSTIFILFPPLKVKDEGSSLRKEGLFLFRLGFSKLLALICQVMGNLGKVLISANLVDFFWFN
jgi:hypothetical protein